MESIESDASLEDDESLEMECSILSSLASINKVSEVGKVGQGLFIIRSRIVDSKAPTAGLGIVSRGRHGLGKK